MSRSRGARNVIVFNPPNTQVVVAEIETVALTGEGWVNLQPALLEDGSPPDTDRLGIGILSAILGRGVDWVPLYSYVPSARTGTRPLPDELGVEHGFKTAVMPKLEAADCRIPDGWALIQDHPRRGMILRVPKDFRADEMVDWCLRSGQVLSPGEMSGEWRALLYGPRLGGGGTDLYSGF